MDPRLVAKTQQYEVSYLARKHGLSWDKAMAILKQAGTSREKANALAQKSRK